MSTPTPRSELAAASLADTIEAEFFAQALVALPICISLCRCSDRWHVVWAGLKAIGLMRTVHAQRTFLRDLLAPRATPGMRVFIAGAADGGSLDTVRHALGDIGAAYHVADLCPAAVALVQQRAAALGLRLTTALAGIDEATAPSPLPPGRGWDLVFIHNTLSFLDRLARQRFMARLRVETAPGGLVLLAVRDKQPEPGAAGMSHRAATNGVGGGEWVHATGGRLSTTFAQHPALRAALLEALPLYAQARRRREATMARQHELLADFDRAGFELIESHRNPAPPAAASSAASAPGSITPWVSLLRRPAA